MGEVNMTRNAASYPCILLVSLLAFVQPAQAQDLFGVRRGYLEAASDEMETKYGTIENHFCEAF